jgi:cellobiose phosphorylase
MKKTFDIKNNQGYYLPLFNLKGIKSSITPYFGGDLKLDQHHYALEPTTEVDLYNNISSRNIVFEVNGATYFLNGQTQMQQSDDLTYEVDLLSQKVIRTNKHFKLEVTSFIPTDANIELHEVKFTNISKQKLDVKITTAIPIYARSADNLRDHRHVTSLLNRIETVDQGVLVQPTLSFDERGHKQNHHVYSVFCQGEHLNVTGYIPILDDYIAGGSLHFPKGLQNLSPSGTEVSGYEAIGAISFEKLILASGESTVFYVSIGISESKAEALMSLNYLNTETFNQALDETKAFFTTYTQGLQFTLRDKKTSEALPWVVLQPMLRRYFGNSFLPHHDYGHGGKGWRDLWQDLLALIMMNDPSVKELLFNNFAGVRIDGTNATIIGDKPGEFKADRNMIVRVWSDHGAWPLLTVKMYVDETGDLDFLLKKQTYFQDQFTHFTKSTRPYQGNIQTDNSKRVYEGTLLEHLLLQNLVGHLNTGQNGFVRLEDADWNDGLDMAHDLGETIAFTHMYANNLRLLAGLIDSLTEEKITIFKELDELSKQKMNLSVFFDKVANFKGDQVKVNKSVLVDRLLKLAEERINLLHQKAFFDRRYQSYINNDGQNADTEQTMNLTGQAMALLSKTASQDQAIMLANTTRELLFNKELGGYHLNSNYNQVLTNMGRAYGFAYGHKENGAIFSHMVMMYAYGLYQYNLVSYGREAFYTLLDRAMDTESRVVAGIPEYFTDRGIGMYPYLTGSASWMLKLLRSEIYGLSMHLGQLTFKPKLKATDFIKHKASITTYLFNKLTTVTYVNPKNLDFGFYKVASVIVDDKETEQPITETQGKIEVILDEIL